MWFKRFVAIFLIVLLGRAGQAQLPEGPGKELVADTCSGCHSIKLVLQHRLSREQWDRTLTWMQKKHNLWKFEKKERKLILDYLAAHFSLKENDFAGATDSSLMRRRVNPL